MFELGAIKYLYSMLIPLVGHLIALRSIISNKNRSRGFLLNVEQRVSSEAVWAAISCFLVLAFIPFSSVMQTKAKVLIDESFFILNQKHFYTLFALMSIAILLSARALKTKKAMLISELTILLSVISVGLGSYSADFLGHVNTQRIAWSIRQPTKLLAAILCFFSLANYFANLKKSDNSLAQYLIGLKAYLMALLLVLTFLGGYNIPSIFDSQETSYFLRGITSFIVIHFKVIPLFIFMHYMRQFGDFFQKSYLRKAQIFAIPISFVLIFLEAL